MTAESRYNARYQIERDNIICLIGKRKGGKTMVIRWIIREADFEGTTIFDGNPKNEDYNLDRDFPNCENVTIINRKFTDPAWDSFDNEANFENKFVIIDECDLIAHYHRDFHRQLVNTGRHVNSGAIFAARRPTMLPRDITANADWTFIFRAKERTVRKFIEESYNENVAEIAKNLGKFEFVAVDASQDPVFRGKLTPDGQKLIILEEYDETWSSEDSAPQNRYSADSRKNADNSDTAA